MQQAPWNDLRSEVHAERWGRVTELLDDWPEDSHEQARDYAGSYGWVPASLDAADLEVAITYHVWSTRKIPKGTHKEFLPTLVLELKETGDLGERIWSATIPEDDGSKGKEECFELTCHVNQGVLAIKPAISMALSQSDMRHQLKMIEACAWIVSVDFLRFFGMIYYDRHARPQGPCPPGIVIEAVDGKPWRSPFDLNHLALTEAGSDGHEIHIGESIAIEDIGEPILHVDQRGDDSFTIATHIDGQRIVHTIQAEDGDDANAIIQKFVELVPELEGLPLSLSVTSPRRDVIDLDNMTEAQRRIVQEYSARWDQNFGGGGMPLAPERLVGVLEYPPEHVSFEGVATNEPVTRYQFQDERAAHRHGLEQVRGGRRRRRRRGE